MHYFTNLPDKNKAVVKPIGIRLVAEDGETIEQLAERLIEAKAAAPLERVIGEFEGVEMHITAKDTVETINRTLDQIEKLALCVNNLNNRLEILEQKNKEELKNGTVE